MRTQEWFDTRAPRAQERIHRDVALGSAGIGTLSNAMHEISRDPRSEDSVRPLAEALVCLSTEEYRFLLGEVGHFVRNEAESGIDDALRILDAMPPDRTSVEPQRVSAFRASEAQHCNSPLAACIFLQALLWAIIPPPRRESTVCY